MSTSAPSSQERVFVHAEPSFFNGPMMIIAGIVGLFVAAAGFALAVVSHAGQLALHSMSTLPTILSVGAIGAGLSMLKTPRRIGVGPSGLTIETKSDTRLLGWHEIGCATIETTGNSQRKRLNVTDLNGKSLVKLDQGYEHFDQMVALISHYVEAKGDDTASIILRKKAKRTAALMFGMGCFMSLACVFVAWHAYDEQRSARLLEEKGQPGEAEILRRFVAPNGVTKRVEYRIVGPNGQSGTKNVEIDPDYWDSLEGAKTIPVILVKDQPNISRPERGEVAEDDPMKKPGGSYLLAGLGGLMGLFFLGFSPFAWSGWDLGYDKNTQIWTLKRYGKVIRTLGSKRP